ncbi:hypothetical protein Tco_0593458 [Tanacetum coccineum]
MSYPHPKRNFVPKAVLRKTRMRPVNAAKPKAAYNVVKRNRFNVVKASALTLTEVIQDQESSEKGSAEVSTAGAKKGIPVWDEEERQRVMFEAKSTKKIDWNDPSVIRPIFEKVWDFNQHIKLMEHGSEKIKSPEKIKEEDVDTQKEMKEMEEDDEKEYLKGYLDIIPREDVVEDVESLSTKYPIMDWKTCVLTENFMYYQIFRGDGSSKNYKVLSEMLEDFDRQDVMDLHRLVKERYSASRPEGYDLMLWGDLHTLFEPNEEDEIWKNQHEYNVISWSLCDFCGVHILLMQNGIAIHMLTEKKYPLSQEMISKMLNKRLEVDHESTQAYELLKFIRSQVQK